MEQSNTSFIQTNERIINKEKNTRKKSKRNNSIKLFLCYGLKISIWFNIILFLYIFLFQKKLSNNNEIKINLLLSFE